MNLQLDHIVLNVKNVAEAVKFYQTIIGLEPERLAEYYRGEAPFPSVRINVDTIIDLFPPERWRKSQVAEIGEIAQAESFNNNLNHFCLTMELADWQALIARLDANQLAIHRGPDKNWGARGEGISVFFFDPDGNEIEARYYPELNPELNPESGDATI